MGELPLHPILERLERHRRPDSPFIGSSTPSAITGWANGTVPAGYVGDVLPIGVSFIGGAFSEAQLISYAFAFEQATDVRVPPTFIPSIGP